MGKKATIPLFKVFMDRKAASAVERVLESGFIGQSSRVEEFEETLRVHFSHQYINTLNSATSGLQLALHMAKDSKYGTEVLTTPLTCTATNFAILAEGLKPRWVDVDPMTGNMDLEDLRSKVSAKTLAVMVVHWGGYPCDLDRLTAIQSSRLFKLPVIEDCAHAWGASYRNRLVGTHGNASVFSFQAIKHLTTGDGGCLLSPDREHYERAKLLRWYGLDRTNSTDFRCSQNIQEWGFKYHMNDIAAAIGLANYENATSLVNLHRDNGLYYHKHLEGVPGLTLLENKPDRASSFWVFTMRVQDREGFVRKMAERGIMVSQVHARNDTHDCLKDYRCHLPNLDIFSTEMICIPCGWWITRENREYIVDVIKEGW